MIVKTIMQLLSVTDFRISTIVVINKISRLFSIIFCFEAFEKIVNKFITTVRNSRSINSLVKEIMSFIL